MVEQSGTRNEVRGNNILSPQSTPDMITIISNHQTYTLKIPLFIIRFVFCCWFVGYPHRDCGTRQLNKQIQKQTINKNIYTIIHPHAREHITSNKKVGTRHKLGYLVPPLSLTERQIAQCKADIDIHHREHGGTHVGTKWNKERGERYNILTSIHPRYDNYHI